MLLIYTQQTLPEYFINSPIVYQTISKQPKTGVYLYYDEHGLSLCKVGEKGRVQVDFTGASAQYRRTKGGGELIAKAVHHSSKPVVWDATAGLGRDGWVLASQGLQVKLFEQHPAVFALLLDGIERAKQIAELADIVANITLNFGNACTNMYELIHQYPNNPPDVVYLDPMYPERQKAAAVKKEMAYFHELVGQSEHMADSELLQIARTIAKKRIVVKRPRLGNFLCNKKPAYQYTGKSTRFDVYLPFQAA